MTTTKQTRKGIFYLTKEDNVEVCLTEGDKGGVLVVKVWDVAERVGVAGMVRVPREVLVGLRVWLGEVLGREEATG